MNDIESKINVKEEELFRQYKTCETKVLEINETLEILYKKKEKLENEIALEKLIKEKFNQ